MGISSILVNLFILVNAMDFITAIFLVVFHPDTFTLFSMLFAAIILGLIFSYLTGVLPGVSITLFVLFSILFTAWLIVKRNNY